MDQERQRHFAMLVEAEHNCPAYPGGFEGRGIVTAGSVHFISYLWLMIHSLRFYGCDLPVELWHMAGEANDGMKRLFEPLNVTFCDAGELQWNTGQIGAHSAHGFKPYCLMHSRFREILFIDADNSVFRNPEFLFDTPEFHATGALFWQDRPDWSLSKGAHAMGMPELRREFGMVDSGGKEFETGQIVLDKAACWKALYLTLHLNRNNAYYYRYLYGDKETFHLAFDFSTTPYTLIAKPPSWRKAQIGQEYTQFGLDGEPLFLHRAGVTKFRMGRPVPAYHRVPNLPERYVKEALKTLRRSYPDIFSQRARFQQCLSGWYWTAPPWAKQVMLKGRALFPKTSKPVGTP